MQRKMRSVRDLRWHAKQATRGREPPPNKGRIKAKRGRWKEKKREGGPDQESKRG